MMCNFVLFNNLAIGTTNANAVAVKPAKKEEKKVVKKEEKVEKKEEDDDSEDSDFSVDDGMSLDGAEQDFSDSDVCPRICMSR